MAESIKIVSSSIFETGTVTVTGTPDTGYNEERLYDRSKNLFWKDTVTEAKTFEVDQGATSILDVTTLAIFKHNFDGEDMQWQYSDNGSAWSDAVTDWTQSGFDTILKELAAATHRYWKVTLTSMTNPQCAEIWMGEAYEFNIKAAPDPVKRHIDHVVWTMSLGGQERSVKLDDHRRGFNYTLRLGTSDFANFEQVVTDLDGFSKPFLFKDKDDNWMIARFEAVPTYDYIQDDLIEISTTIIEML